MSGISRNNRTRYVDEIEARGGQWSERGLDGPVRNSIDNYADGGWRIRSGQPSEIDLRKRTANRLPPDTDR